jgi:hypothetical protein
MKQLTAQQKHDILVHIRERREGQRPADIAALHGVTIGRTTLWEWQQQWDSTPQSLEHKRGGGRPRALSKAQVTRHVAAPIRNSNRAGRAVRYTALLPQVQAATGSELSVRTMQRYGKEEAGGHKARGKKRTADESESSRTSVACSCCMCVARAYCASASCLHLTFSVR